MFDFTKEVVINSADKFDVVAAHDNVPAKFRVHGGGEYFGKYVVEGNVYKTEPKAGNPFKLKLTPVSVKSGDVQYCIELGLDRGDARGDWGSAMYYFKKPLLITVSKEATADDIANAFRKVGSGYGMINVPEHKGASEVTINGGDDKIKVRGVKVYNIDGDNVNEIKVSEGTEYTYTENVVEFGTANYLLHNLRMPTYENYRFTSPAAVEMPVAGSEYVQYTFLYCVPRPGLGGLSVAGQTNHSTTTHVFYVAKGAVADAFEAAIANVGTVKAVDTKFHGLDKFMWEPHVSANASAIDGLDARVDALESEENA